MECRLRLPGTRLPRTLSGTANCAASPASAHRVPKVNVKLPKGHVRVTIETVQRTDAQAVTEVVVDAIEPEAAGVVSLILRRPDSGALPPWNAGSHIDVILPSGIVRQYSLCGDPQNSDVYRIAVLREPNSRGGSEEVHGLTVGQVIAIRGPRNTFALVGAPSYLFLAGGIGITPIISMIREVIERGARWRLIYGGRSRKSMAFLDELQALGSTAIEIACYDEHGYPDFASEIAALDARTVIYACGPPSMLTKLEGQCQELRRDPMLHFERFTADRQMARPRQGAEEDGEFEVELAKTGVTLKVGPGESLLHVIRTVVPTILYSCEEGYCGTCETRVLSGIPDHRDEVLSDEERDAGDTMMICVGRSKTTRIVLDV
jgi:ferredoxin-NADP reductase